VAAELEMADEEATDALSKGEGRPRVEADVVVDVFRFVFSAA
jgi:hypothetical protein